VQDVVEARMASIISTGTASTTVFDVVGPRPSIV
jgi:hypothetical protein